MVSNSAPPTVSRRNSSVTRAVSAQVPRARKPDRGGAAVRWDIRSILRGRRRHCRPDFPAHQDELYARAMTWLLARRCPTSQSFERGRGSWTSASRFRHERRTALPGSARPVGDDRSCRLQRGGRGPSGGGPVTASCVANAWHESRRQPFATNVTKRVCAGQPHNANDDHPQSLSVPRLPWYY